MYDLINKYNNYILITNILLQQEINLLIEYINIKKPVNTHHNIYVIKLLNNLNNDLQI